MSEAERLAKHYQGLATLYEKLVSAENRLQSLRNRDEEKQAEGRIAALIVEIEKFKKGARELP